MMFRLRENVTELDIVFMREKTAFLQNVKAIPGCFNMC